MAKYPGVMLYFDRLTFLDQLSLEQLGLLFTAIIRYARDDVPPEFTDAQLKLVWEFLCPSLDQDKLRYMEIFERNRRNIERRWAKRDTTVCSGIPNTNTTPKTTTNTNTYSNTNTNAQRNDLELAERILSRRCGGN